MGIAVDRWRDPRRAGINRIHPLYPGGAGGTDVDRRGAAWIGGPARWRRAGRGPVGTGRERSGSVAGRWCQARVDTGFGALPTVCVDDLE